MFFTIGFLKFLNIYMKTYVLESLFDKVEKKDFNTCVFL